MSIDLVLRIAVAFLKDINLEDFKQLVYETQYLITDINSFENEKIPRDSSIQDSNSSHNPREFYIHNPRYEAELLLCHILNFTRVEIHAKSQEEIKDYDKQRYFKLLAMRKNGTPIEYLINKTGFYGIELYVNNLVLIPRSETEILVEKAIKFIQENGITSFIEVGTGSGAISISILKNLFNVSAIATDISPQALSIANHNADAQNVKDRCNFIESNLLDFYTESISIQLLISNPPYIAMQYPLSQEVLCEPHIALFGGEKGDEILRELIKQASNKNIPYLICEMGYDQKDSMAQILEQMGYIAEFYKDYAGFDRGFIARLRSLN
ncbi:peptide chain release factor N(5)-glutamine methyltransferase [Helicobacter muridarum]|uniref:peptide chain release factor N(5)-glutamine methyltransferase n=1 Tax=Helicobacter muridarum TaxID=216 RepID=A0A4U8TP46_9HELI|nr:peptide chain release factor N(5)-glutamine methyltransferase [Helicobacter muridarum]